MQLRGFVGPRGGLLATFLPHNPPQRAEGCFTDFTEGTRQSFTVLFTVFCSMQILQILQCLAQAQPAPRRPGPPTNQQARDGAQLDVHPSTNNINDVNDRLMANLLFAPVLVHSVPF